MKKFLLRLTAVLVLTLATQAEAQERAGVVTTLEGNVTVMRASLSQPAALKFKDDIFVKDRITTGTNAVARILLGGRAVVTVRERSVVTITEVPGVSTVDVVAGRAAVAVAREKMQAGDLVEVRTPNAVAGIRGTVIVAEVFDPTYSVITVLKGVIDVKRMDGGRLGHATVVTALQRVTVADRAPVSAPQSVGPEAARRLGQEFRVAPPRVTPSAAIAPVNQAEVERTARYLSSLLGAANPSQNAVDDDQDAFGEPDGAGMRRDAHGKPEKADKIEKAGRSGRADRGRDRDRTAETVSAVKANGPSASAINNLGEALKNNDRGGRKNKSRDR
jgi:FecR protein